MLLYLFLSLLFGLGAVINIIENEKKKGEFKKIHYIAYFLFFLIMPIILPVIIGYGICNNVYDDEYKK